MKNKPTTSKLRKKAWTVLSLWYRQSQASAMGLCQCYTCGSVHHWKEIQAAHAIGGRHNAVLFDLELIRLCCYHCNVGLRGNYQVFITKLIRENGLAWWEAKLEASRKIVKYTRTELFEMIEDYQSRPIPSFRPGAVQEGG